MGSADPILIKLKIIIIPPTMGSMKVKGLLKGLRYISQVFEEDKKQEIQIGGPTDVKHLAHVGCDGPAQESPSWMKGYGTPDQFASSDLSDGPEWVSEDSGQKVSRRDKIKARHRRHRSVENMNSESKEATKARQPRRHHTRGAEGRHAGDEALPEVPKRTRKKKPKDGSGDEASKVSKSKAPDDITDQE
ncbi:unnamed protein product [Lactuca virosa]|uniref:CRIB domain-containing protein n=1 Tax=Lactuca virosa TaxID=75947 RepID=A0AAU9M3J4_9ASTR|nr:unnamed protein product [Lactuca virosa]